MRDGAMVRCLAHHAACVLCSVSKETPLRTQAGRCDRRRQATCLPAFPTPTRRIDLHSITPVHRLDTLILGFSSSRNCTSFVLLSQSFPAFCTILHACDPTWQSENNILAAVPPAAPRSSCSRDPYTCRHRRSCSCSCLCPCHCLSLALCLPLPLSPTRFTCIGT